MSHRGVSLVVLCVIFVACCVEFCVSHHQMFELEICLERGTKGYVSLLLLENAVFIYNNIVVEKYQLKFQSSDRNAAFSHSLPYDDDDLLIWPGRIIG